jgi:DNA-binding LacI/PurR family transcriptional regulator
LVIGFDDAPVAERLDFTTIAIPWEDVASAAVAVHGVPENEG